MDNSIIGIGVVFLAFLVVAPVAAVVLAAAMRSSQITRRQDGEE